MEIVEENNEIHEIKEINDDNNEMKNVVVEEHDDEEIFLTQGDPGIGSAQILGANLLHVDVFLFTEVCRGAQGAQQITDDNTCNITHRFSHFLLIPGSLYLKNRRLQLIST